MWLGVISLGFKYWFLHKPIDLAGYHGIEKPLFFMCVRLQVSALSLFIWDGLVRNYINVLRIGVCVLASAMSWLLVPAFYSNK